MSTYRAVVATSHAQPPTIQHLPRPTVANGEILIRVLAASFVPYMKQILDGSLHYPLTFPLTPGSNAIGRVEEAGPDAVSLTKGQLVFCDITIHGRDDPDVQILLGMFGGGYPAAQKLMDGRWRNGTYAELTLLPLENVFALDEEVLVKQKGYSMADLCYLGNCLVPFGGIAEIDVKAGDTVIVAPATGKFSGAAVTTALAVGATVIAAGRSKEKLRPFEEVYGATGRIKTVVLTGDVETDTNALKAATPHGKGADAYIDFSPGAAAGSTHIVAALGALRKEGTAVLSGGIHGPISIPYPLFTQNNIRMVGKFMFDRAQIVRAIKMIESGNLPMGKDKAGVESVRFGLDQFAEAVEKAAKLTAWGQQVVLEP